MRPPRELVLVLVLAPLVAAAEPAVEKPAPEKPAQEKPAQEKPGSGFLGISGGGSKKPITITSDQLEYEYKDGIIVYRGDVQAEQGDVKLRSNELRITLVKEQGKDKAKPPEGMDDASAGRLQTVVASGNVRIDQGARWAVGGRATFDQTNRTLILTENPVLHDGPNEVAGDRVVVYLDQDRSIVEGGRKRVKAVLHPSEGDKEKPGTGKEKPDTGKEKPPIAGTTPR